MEIVDLELVILPADAAGEAELAVEQLEVALGEGGEAEEVGFGGTQLRPVWISVWAVVSLSASRPPISVSASRPGDELRS